jgi:hypothetical protein
MLARNGTEIHLFPTLSNRLPSESLNAPKKATPFICRATYKVRIS